MLGGTKARSVDLLKGRDGELEGGEQSFLKINTPANRKKCGIKTIGLAKTTVDGS